jgi:hypothetical protein
VTDDLDTRARAAAVALHDSVRDLTVPAHTPQRPRLRLAVAAAAVVTVIAAGIALRDRGSGETDVVSGVGDVPRFVLDPPPAGLLPTGAVDLPFGGIGAITQTYWVYGDPDAADPFGNAELGVVITQGSDAELVPPDDSREVDVDGRSAWVSTSRGPAESRSITFETDAGTIAYLASSTLTDGELVEAAGEVAPADEPPGSLVGLDLVAKSSGEPTGTIPLPVPTTLGHIVGYQTQDDSVNKVIAVASVAGGEDAYLVARWALGPTGRAIRIRGAEAWVGSPFGDSSTLLVWRESPTNLVALSAFGLDEAATRAAAEGLEAASDDTWAALLAATGAVRMPSSGQAGVSGRDEDGPSYVAYVDGDGSLCLDVETSDGSSGSCTAADGGSLIVASGALGDGRFVVYGLTTLGTDGEVRITADDGPAGSEAYYEGGTVFAFIVGTGELPREVVVRAADGTELGRAAVPAPGSATFEGTATTMSG